MFEAALKNHNKPELETAVVEFSISADHWEQKANMEGMAW